MQATHSQLRVRRPASLAERGAVVPFEAPPLFAARVRADERHGPVMLLHNFAENGSVFVVPWRDAPNVLTVHGSDETLHGAIGEAKASTPDSVRAVVRRVAGIADAEGEQALLPEIQVRLLVYLLRDLGFDAAQLDIGRTVSHIPDLMRFAAARAGPAAAGFFRRTVTLATELLPMGLPGAAGPMRRLYQDIAAFERHLRRRSETASPEARPYYAGMIQAASDAIGSSEACFARIERSLAGLAAPPSAWLLEEHRIRDSVGRLAWILDGWEPMLGRYAGYLEQRDRMFHERELALIAGLAPLLPAGELLGSSTGE